MYKLISFIRFFFNPFAFLLLLSALTACAQSPSGLSQRCASPYRSSYGTAGFGANGDFTFTPCPTRSTIFTGGVDFSGATITGVIGGSGTVNYIPRFTAASTLGNTPLSWNGTLYTFENTGLNATFKMEFTPATGGSGLFRVGSTGTTNFLQIAPASNIITAYANEVEFRNTLSGAGGMKINGDVVLLGDFDFNTNGTYLSITDSTATYNFHASNSAAAIFDLDEVGTYQLSRTITAGGTTGNRTINKPAGTVNLAAGASSIVVTNNTVTTSSIVLATVRTNDATCTVKNAVPTANTITITMTAACTAETSVGFLVTN